MSEYKVCSFFGHRKINVDKNFINNLKNKIEDLIINHNVKKFLFGSNSQFNTLCFEIVNQLKNKYNYIKKVGYSCKSECFFLENEKEKWEKIFSKYEKENVTLNTVDEDFSYKDKYVAGKGSYVQRNLAMIDDSDICLFYYDKNYIPQPRKVSKRSVNFYTPKSGTKICFEYALKNNKKIINVFC